MSIHAEGIEESTPTRMQHPAGPLHSVMSWVVLRPQWFQVTATRRAATAPCLCGTFCNLEYFVAATAETEYHDAREVFSVGDGGETEDSFVLKQLLQRNICAQVQWLPYCVLPSAGLGFLCSIPL